MDDLKGALDRFAASWGHGRRPSWKTLLRDAWESGNYPAFVAENDVQLLQQARNTRGPRWLERYVPDWNNGRLTRAAVEGRS